jgi:hypothetical protein
VTSCYQGNILDVVTIKPIVGGRVKNSGAVDVIIIRSMKGIIRTDSVKELEYQSWWVY